MCLNVAVFQKTVALNRIIICFKNIALAVWAIYMELLLVEGDFLTINHALSTWRHTAMGNPFSFGYYELFPHVSYGIYGKLES